MCCSLLRVKRLREEEENEVVIIGRGDACNDGDNDDGDGEDADNDDSGLRSVSRALLEPCVFVDTCMSTDFEPCEEPKILQNIALAPPGWSIPPVWGTSLAGKAFDFVDEVGGGPR